MECSVTDLNLRSARHREQVKSFSTSAAEMPSVAWALMKSSAAVTVLSFCMFLRVELRVTVEAPLNFSTMGLAVFERISLERIAIACRPARSKPGAMLESVGLAFSQMNSSLSTPMMRMSSGTESPS